METGLEPSLFTAKKFLQYLLDQGKGPKYPAPKTVVVSYIPFVAHNYCKEPDWLAEKFLGATLYLANDNSGVAVLTDLGIGSPSVAAKVDELCAFGVDSFIGVGTAATLNESHRPGDLVVIHAALSQEGTSAHYGRVDPIVSANPELSGQLLDALPKMAKAEVAATTDAPYRETSSAIKDWQSHGVNLVEMEASALYTVAKCNEAKATSLCVISDSLAKEEWHPSMHWKPVKISLTHALSIAIATVRS